MTIEEQILDAMKRYEETFGEEFPLFLALGMGNKGLLALIEKCIAEKEPLKPDKGIIY